MAKPGTARKAVGQEEGSLDFDLSLVNLAPVGGAPPGSAAECRITTQTIAAASEIIDRKTQGGCHYVALI
jgi:acetyl-CoA carboxylase alpha subunit